LHFNLRELKDSCQAPPEPRITLPVSIFKLGSSRPDEAPFDMESHKTQLSIKLAEQQHHYQRWFDMDFPILKEHFYADLIAE